MLFGQEMAGLVNKFKAGMASDTGTKENFKHHEGHRSFQVSFYQDVKSLVAAVKNLGNPFVEEMVIIPFMLNPKVIAKELLAVSRMNHIKSVGKEQCENLFLSLS